MMSGILEKNIKVGVLLWGALHQKGFRYLFCVNYLPGKPDLAFSKYKAVIQINGCFWRGHNCHLFKWLSTIREFSYKKIITTKDRDLRNKTNLKKWGGGFWMCGGVQ